MQRIILIKIRVKVPYTYGILTLKALSKFVMDDILKSILLFFEENKTWHFM